MSVGIKQKFCLSCPFRPAKPRVVSEAVERGRHVSEKTGVYGLQSAGSQAQTAPHGANGQRLGQAPRGAGQACLADHHVSNNNNNNLFYCVCVNA
jgi:hypothetical protein